MKKLIALLFLIQTIISFGQTKENLLGKWQFQEIAGQDTLDPESTKMLSMFFGEMQLYFDATDNYKTFMMGQEEQGTWTLINEDKVIQMTSEKGRINEVQLVSIDQNELVIQLSKGTFILNRVETSAEDEQFEEVEKIETVSATVDQVAKTWYRLAKDNPNRSKEENELVKALAEGSFLKLNSKGSYKMEALLKEKGTWEFNEDKTTITLSSDSKSQIWYISEVSEDKLVLLKGKKSSRWEFSTEKQ